MANYFDFTVSLQDVLPRPWRRFLIGGTASFAALSAAIQSACGWAGSHLYEFRAARAYDSETIAGFHMEGGWEDDERPVPDASRVKLSRYFGRDRFTTCLYLYDFGDGWTHDVQLNDIVQLRERFGRRLLAGERPFPPDDCGGPGGFVELMEAMHTGKDPEELVTWARETWGWTGEFNLATATKKFDR